MRYTQCILKISYNTQINQITPQKSCEKLKISICTFVSMGVLIQGEHGRHIILKQHFSSESIML